MIAPWLIWFVLGIGLAALELVMPGLIIFFFAVGAIVTAGVVLLFETSLTQQILVFLCVSVVSLLTLRSRLSRIFRGSKMINNADSYDDFPSGATARVIRAITPIEQGRIHYRGTDWYATADETIEVGATVAIVRYADSSRQIFFVQQLNNPHEGKNT
ncbi:MAG: NfeD family protein [Anaerolineales bacterium]